jgi:hypothetical protein
MKPEESNRFVRKSGIDCPAQSIQWYPVDFGEHSEPIVHGPGQNGGPVVRLGRPSHRRFQPSEIGGLGQVGGDDDLLRLAVQACTPGNDHKISNSGVFNKHRAGDDFNARSCTGVDEGLRSSDDASSSP